MGTADIVTKEYMRENTVFADAFNYLIYNGKKVIDPAKLTEIDSGIAKPKIGKVIFLWCFNICFSFNVIFLRRFN